MKQEYIQIILTVAVVAAAAFFLIKRILSNLNSKNSDASCSKCAPEKLKD